MHDITNQFPLLSPLLGNCPTGYLKTEGDQPVRDLIKKEFFSQASGCAKQCSKDAACHSFQYNKSKFKCKIWRSGDLRRPAGSRLKYFKSQK